MQIVPFVFFFKIWQNLIMIANTAYLYKNVFWNSVVLNFFVVQKNIGNHWLKRGGNFIFVETL